LRIGTLLLTNNGVDVPLANIVCCMCALAGDRCCLIASTEEGAVENARTRQPPGLGEGHIEVSDPFSALSSASER